MEEKKFDKIAYNNQFNINAYDRINLTVPKGKKDEIKAHAEALGESVNGYLWRLIQEDMARNKEG